MVCKHSKGDDNDDEDADGDDGADDGLDVDGFQSNKLLIFLNGAGTGER